LTEATEPFRSSLLRRRWTACAGLALLLQCCSTAGAQDVTEPSLKAAFVYNFAKFTEWPPDVLPAADSLSACVLGDPSVEEALARTVKGRLLSGHTISVTRVQLEGPLRSCHLLYLSGLTAQQMAAVVTAVQGASVLTISDADDFALLGGIAHVFIENGRMRFDLNLDLARRSRLQLSSKVLALAKQVIDARGSPER
jgi:hypothetical protein